MKTRSGFIASAGLILGCLFLGGCNDASKPSAPVPSAESKSTMKTVVEGVTGKAAVDQGLSAKKQLDAVDKLRRTEMEALEQ